MRRGFTLLEVLVASSLLFALMTMVGLFLIEVTSIYYGGTARSAYAQQVTKLAEMIGSDVASTHQYFLFPSYTEEDRDELSDAVANDQGGTFLVLIHAEPRYTTAPDHYAITRIVAYAVDRDHPILGDNNEVKAYRVLRYEVEPASDEDWLRDPADLAMFTPIDGNDPLNQPARFTSIMDYVPEVLQDADPRTVATIDANSAFSIENAFILRPNRLITITFGIINSSGMGDQAEELRGHDIVSNTFNYSFQAQG
ncbi:MAG: hypothetical protein E1N59_2376 [Puniceicoccaceae bacterium 5H]|nr:MAG: hypothetical protein E1N59_2376 [Puniceicoccaceae bacterium 5H]